MEFSKETLRIFFREESRGAIVLPDFQRDFVWSIEKQKKLLSSLIVGLPIGSVLMLRGTKDDFPSRRLGVAISSEPVEECRFLLDGQQRLSCIKSVFDDLYLLSEKDWKETWDKLYAPLRNRWYLKINTSPNEDDTFPDQDDIFGYKSLRFNKESLSQYEPDQIQDYIFTYKILVKEAEEKIYHPAYIPKDDNDNLIEDQNQKALVLSKKLAAKKLVPLYEIYRKGSESTSIHRRVLKQISNEKREYLLAKIKDNKINANNLLGHINPDISNDSSESELDDALRDLATQWATDFNSALESLLEIELLETILPTAEIARAAAIFETINESGTPLNNFDLIVAKTAKAGTRSLVDTLKEWLSQEFQIPVTLSSQSHPTNALIDWNPEAIRVIKDNSIDKVFKEELLNTLSIICYSSGEDFNVDKISVDYIKRNKILNLKPTEINKNIKIATSSLIKAFSFLQFRCGVIFIGDLHYKLMLLPIAYCFFQADSKSLEIEKIDEIKIELKPDNIQDPLELSFNYNDSLLNKIEYWYWLSLFSGRYSNRQNEQCIEDLKKLYKWCFIEGYENPFKTDEENILNKDEYATKSLLLHQEDNLPSTAIRTEILQFILASQPKDFLLNSINYDNSHPQRLKALEIAKNQDRSLETHHIIPLDTATKIEESTKVLRRDKKHILNSPLNLTDISKAANRKISDLSPKQYFEKLTSTSLDDHIISTSMESKLKEAPDDFNNAFYKEVLESRFDELSRKVTVKLEKLLEVE
ncbi:DUF262 domain-containing protein [Synechocystis sp. PCC 7339]|uniref:DUF262 domain-containing protein n=1 Tax=Synechocystis sp. PCC 7339 TaxID=2782213 RepID=UPI001CBA9AAF|nr:DUF262 domain-containing protein [Synechocystis sp. PCC 7339]UAJ73779.1 DUF262 domain-containing protein [Synechocystis sp. PCC 7339]